MIKPWYLFLFLSLSAADRFALNYLEELHQRITRDETVDIQEGMDKMWTWRDDIDVGFETQDVVAERDGRVRRRKESLPKKRSDKKGKDKKMRDEGRGVSGNPTVRVHIERRQKADGKEREGPQSVAEIHICT